MKNICFHHDDPDGLMSAAIVKESVLDCEFVKMSYGYDEDEFKAMYINDEKYNKIIIVDFSFPSDMLIQLNTICEELIWCDHHQSAMEKYENLWFDENVKGLRALNKSGCRLTWEYFHPNETTPYAVDLIEDFDLWKFKYGNRTKEFSEALYFETDLSQFKIMMYDTNKVFELCNKGRILLEQKWKRVESASDKGYFINWEGYNTYVVNTPEDISTLGNYVCNNPELNADVGLIFYETENGYNVSLRSIGDVDVAKIAQKYGGGGHKNAAGFNVKKNERTW